MNQEQFLLVLKPEFHLLSHDEEADFSCSNINPGLGVSQE